MERIQDNRIDCSVFGGIYYSSRWYIRTRSNEFARVLKNLSLTLNTTLATEDRNLNSSFIRLGKYRNRRRRNRWPGFYAFLGGRRRESCLPGIERSPNVITLVVKHRLLNLKTTSSFTEPIEFHSSRK